MIQAKIRAKKRKGVHQVENSKERSRQKLEQQKYGQGNLGKGVSLGKPNNRVHKQEASKEY